MINGSGTITQANGKKATYTSTDTRVAPGSWDKSQVITTASGKTIDRTVDTSVANGKGTRTVTTTGPNGQTVTRDATFNQSVNGAGDGTKQLIDRPPPSIYGTGIAQTLPSRPLGTGSSPQSEVCYHLALVEGALPEGVGLR